MNNIEKLAMIRKAFRVLAIITGVLTIVFYCIGYYVNHYMPHGPKYATGDYVCLNDGRGPCGEEYKEDLRGLEIPGWAIIFRKYGIGLFFGALFISICLWHQSKNYEIG
jgi:hypothetical protein